MANAIRSAPRQHNWILLGAPQGLLLGAKYTDLTGERGDRFRLMLETRAIDQPNRIMGADQCPDCSHDLVGRST